MSASNAIVWDDQPHDIVWDAPPDAPPHDESLLRKIALGGRAVGQGVFNTLAAVPDALIGLGNVGIDAANTHLGTHIPVQRTFSGDLNDVLNQAGAPNPETPNEQTGTAIAQGVAGALTGAGALSPANTQPILNAVSGAAGAGAGELARRNDAGPAGQAVASMAGALVPGMASAGVPTLVKTMMRGGEAGRISTQEALADFAGAGVTPRADQVTGGKTASAVASVLSKTPGGMGPMSRAGDRQAVQMQTALEDRAAQLSTASSAEQAGRSITKGISGPGGFVEKFKAQSSALYDDLDNHIPQGQPVDVSHTQAALEALNADIPGAPNVSKLFKNAKIQGVDQALTADVTAAESFGGRLPFVALKKLRTLVDNQVSDWNMASDVPRSKWIALRSAISEDLGAAAKAAGPDATRAWNRANLYYSAGIKRIEAIDAVVNANGGAENIFNSAMSGTREGATRLRAVMQSLPEDAQKDLSATVIRRLGRAVPSAQDAAGDQFSVETFLTNWNRVSPEAKSTLFNRYGTGFADDMDRIAKVAARLRQSNQVLKNPSGTAQAVGWGSAAGTFLTLLGTGHLLPAAGVAGSVGAGNIAARVMTNPDFVKWLGTATKLPPSMAPMLVGVLAQKAQNLKDPDLAQAAAALQDLTQPSQQNGYP